ncbi:MAG: ThuA domain-containing protein [Trueperaceae bacterium]
MAPLKVTIWNEYLHELEHDSVAAIYPDGIHGALRAAMLERYPDALVRTATLRQPDHGLSDELLDDTDVLFWWGHKAHAEVADAWADKVHQAVLGGMGLVVLHSGHFSKPFKRVLGSNASLLWREADEKERLWNLQPSHPILEGVPAFFELEQEEMYGERFDVPTPDELLMISWFQGGEVFRSLCTWRRGHGQVVYFRPGHETYPTYHHPLVRRIVTNAAAWAARRVVQPTDTCTRSVELEPVPNPAKEHI